MVQPADIRLQRVLEHAQSALLNREHYHAQRDPVYREVLALVEEMMGLLLEVRRNRAALEEIARLREECLRTRDPRALALRMSDLAGGALGMPTEPAIAVTVAVAPAQVAAPIVVQS